MSVDCFQQSTWEFDISQKKDEIKCVTIYRTKKALYKYECYQFCNFIIIINELLYCMCYLHTHTYMHYINTNDINE